MGDRSYNRHSGSGSHDPIWGNTIQIWGFSDRDHKFVTGQVTLYSNHVIVPVEHDPIGEKFNVIREWWAVDLQGHLHGIQIWGGLKEAIICMI
jgi:hypothetical protein